MKRLRLDMRILSLLFLCATLWGFSQTAEAVVTKQFPLKNGGLVTLKNSNGKVEIEGWDKEEFYMEAEKQVKAGSREKAEKMLAEVEIMIDQSANEISIEAREPQQMATNCRLISTINCACRRTAGYRLTTPMAPLKFPLWRGKSV